MIAITTNARTKVFDVIATGFYVFQFSGGIPAIFESTNLGNLTSGIAAYGGTHAVFLEEGDELWVTTGNGLSLLGGRCASDEL